MSGLTSVRRRQTRPTDAPAAGTVLAHPSNATPTQGDDFTLTANVSGYAPIERRWQKNGADITDSESITGSTTETLTFTGADGALHDGSYRLRFATPFENYASQFTNEATVAVSTAPSAPVLALSSSPAGVPGTGILTVTSSEGSTVVLTITAQSPGGSALSYQWQKQAKGTGPWVNKAGATGPTRTLSGLAVAQDDDRWRCVVTNSVGSTTSDEAVLVVGGVGDPDPDPDPDPTTRNLLRWPGGPGWSGTGPTSYTLWVNTAIGEDSVLVDLDLWAPGDQAAYTPTDANQPLAAWPNVKVHSAEEDHWINTPNNPYDIPVYYDPTGFSGDKNRCDPPSNQPAGWPKRYPIPIDDDWAYPHFVGNSRQWPTGRNNCGGIVRRDGVVVETQPIEHCPQGLVTTRQEPENNTYTLGTTDQDVGGSHGGSGLPAGLLCLKAEQFIDQEDVRQVIGVVVPISLLYPTNNPYSLAGGEGYVWPARRADGKRNDFIDTRTPRSTEDKLYTALAGSWLGEGCLLTLPDEFDPDSMESDPGRIIATQCKNFGWVICDGAGEKLIDGRYRLPNDQWHLCTEWSPTRRVSREFVAKWGMEFYGSLRQQPNNLWLRDMATIIRSLVLNVSNKKSTPGGIGARRDPRPTPMVEV